jgi:predicted PurR-regulated permease PerM
MKKNASARAKTALRHTGAARTQPAVKRAALRARLIPAAAPAERAEGDAPHLSAGFAVSIVAVITLIVFLKWAGELLVPLLLGIILTYTLAPFVNWLERGHIPRALGALLVLAALVGGAGWVGNAVSGDVQAMADQLPDMARKLRVKIMQLSAGEDNILRKVQDAANELDKAAVESASPKGTAAVPAPAPPPAAPVSSTLKSWLGSNMNSMMQGTAQAIVVLLLAYSLLAAGPLFRRKLMSLVGPNLSEKKEALRTLEEIQHQMQTFFLGLTATNAVIGLAIWGAFFALGVENPGFWGLAAALLHFIPYAGPLLMASASGLAVFVQTGVHTEALLVAAIALAVNAAIGVGVLTWMQAHVYRVSATALFLSLLFFGWLWGAWGVLLAAPLIGVMKVICDRVSALERFAVILAP